MVLQPQKPKKYGDPFAVDPLPKAHYHPSKQRYLSNEQRKTAISPVRAARPSKTKDEETAISPADEMFLRGGNSYSTKTPVKDNDDESNKFDESWPSSERPSSVSITGNEDHSPFTISKLLQGHERKDRFSDLKQTLEFLDRDRPVSLPHRPQRQQQKPEESTLQRYIERFRKGEPMSREERQRKTESSSKDFWWISERTSPPSDTSTPREESDDVEKPFSSYMSKKKDKTVSDVLASPIDEETRKLQERADKLLERSISTVASSDPVVSTDGLGSSPGGTMSSFDEPPYRPSFARDLDKNSVPKFQLDMPLSEGYVPGRPAAKYQLPRISKPTRPEDDILHQWRVKRRLEEARSLADQKSAKTNKFGFLSKPKDQGEEATRLDHFRQRLAGSKISENLRTTGVAQFTPAPESSRVSTRYPDLKTWADETDIKSVSQEYEPESKPAYPPVASPTLKRKSQSKQSDLEPHLHLMCDLLPCPHQQKYGEVFKSQESGAEGKQESHYKYLQAERPDVEKLTKSQSSEVREKTVGVDPSEKDSIISSDSERNKVKEERKIYTSSQLKRSQRSMKHDGIDSQSEENRSDIDGSEAKRTSKKSVTIQNNGATKYTYVKNGESDNSMEEVIIGKESQMNEAGEKLQYLRPRQCKSPSKERQKQPVDSAIGQVVKNRLFTASTSTVISSIDSASSVTHSQQQFDPRSSEGAGQSDGQHKMEDGKSRHLRRPPSPKHSSPKVSLQANEKSVDIENDEMYESDGEFPEDQLLQMLRQQRSKYEEQLQHIDNLLAGIVDKEEKDDVS